MSFFQIGVASDISYSKKNIKNIQIIQEVLLSKGLYEVMGYFNRRLQQLIFRKETFSRSDKNLIYLTLGS